MSCVFISVLTDNIFYLISFESSAFRRGSNLFPLVYRIAEAKDFKSILKLLLNKKHKSWLILIFARIRFCELKKSYFASAYLGEWQTYENFASTYLCKWQVFENFEFINFSPKEKRIRKKQLNQGTFG